MTSHDLHHPPCHKLSHFLRPPPPLERDILHGRPQEPHPKPHWESRTSSRTSSKIKILGKTSLGSSLRFSMRISMRSCPRSWFLIRFLMRFLTFDEVLGDVLDSQWGSCPRHRINRIKESSYWLSCASAHKGQPRKLWKTFSSIMGLDKVSSIPIKGLTAQELMDYFIEKIESIRKSTGGSTASTRLPAATSTLSSFEEYSAEEIQKIIESSPTKSCSLDPVPTSILKEFLPELLPFITMMCNRSLQEDIQPPSQKHAVITPIIKKAGSDPLDVRSYRPVSNLSYMSKLVERMVSRRLTCFLEGEKLLPKFQPGFRARHSTETAILKVLSDILTAADLGKVSILGLLDMSAAFDTVDHSILFDRLETAYGFSGTVLSWMRSFLKIEISGLFLVEAHLQHRSSNLGCLKGVSSDHSCLFSTQRTYNTLQRVSTWASTAMPTMDSFISTIGVQALPGVISKVVSCIAEIESWMNSNRLKLNSEKTQFTVHLAWKSSWASQNLYNLHQPWRMHGRFSEDCEWSRCDNRLPAFHERSRTTCMHDGILSSPAVEIDPWLVVSGLLLDSGPDLHPQQDRLLQQSPGWSRQISGGQATINFACSCLPDHAEKEVRPDLRRHPRQAPLASSRARIQFKIGVLVYRCLHGNAPSYLSEMLTAAADVSGRRSLRLAARGDLVIPRTRTLGYGSRMFAVSGPSFLNSLPLGLRDISLTESVFRRQLKTFLFRNAYGINLLVQSALVHLRNGLSIRSFL